MSSLGLIGAYEEGTETWQLYQDRLEQYFIAKDVKDDKKRAQPIEIPEPPAMVQDSVARGSKIYEDQGCTACEK